MDSRDKSDMARWLEKYPPGPRQAGARPREDNEEEHLSVRAARERRLLRTLEPQRVLDLHGTRVEEAVQKTTGFLKKSKELGLKKVLIIHGKGHHSRHPPVLAKRIQQLVQALPVAGEWGTASRRLGGSGAIWVLLR
jgi:DNA-nicking Smr family endonuclease